MLDVDAAAAAASGGHCWPDGWLAGSPIHPADALCAALLETYLSEARGAVYV